MLINSSVFSSVAQTAAEWIGRDIPVINGIDIALRAMRNFLGYPEVTRSIEATHATFDASASRSHSFATICEEKPGHKAPPNGDSQHLVNAKLKMLGHTAARFRFARSSGS